MPIVLDNPYRESGGGQHVWLRGNLHAHSTRSDGKRQPQEVINDYAALGYNFLGLSDHDLLSNYEGLDAKGLVLIAASEVSAGGPHILQLGARQRIEPYFDRQKVLADISASGGLAVMCHPDWQQDYNHCSFEKLADLKEYAGIEIFNGGCLRAPGSAWALNKWDRLLAAGRRVWGYASDDCHCPVDEGQGWIMVRLPADRISPEGIIDALRRGSFYASTGAIIEQIETNGADLHVYAPAAQAIEVVGEYGRRLDFVEKPEMRFDAASLTDSHIRVQCWGKAGRTAWTQPFMLRGGTGERLHRLLLEKPALHALRLKRGMRLPVDADDPLWKEAPESAVFYRNGDGGVPAAATGLCCLLTAQHLVFAVRCAEPRMAELRTQAGQGASNLWSDDCVEFFLDTEGRGASYFHLVVNTLGYWWSGHTADPSRHLACECRAARRTNEYNLQVAIPLASLGRGITTVPGTVWGFHFSRNRTPTREIYFWSWTGGANNNSACFGQLEF